MYFCSFQVLTNNMGNVLGFNKAEEKLDKCNSNELNFEEYLKLLKSEVLADSKLYTSPNAETIKEICWMLYKCKAWEISNQQKLHSNDAFILWKLFNFLCETDDSGCYSLPLVMDRDEIEVLFERFGLVSSQHADQNSMVNVLQNGKNVFLFPKILALFERQYLSRLRDDEISLGLKEIHEEIINDVMKKVRCFKNCFYLNFTLIFFPNFLQFTFSYCLNFIFSFDVHYDLFYLLIHVILHLKNSIIQQK